MQHNGMSLKTVTYSQNIKRCFQYICTIYDFEHVHQTYMSTCSSDTAYRHTGLHAVQIPRKDIHVYKQYSYRVQTCRSTCSTVTAYRQTGIPAVQLPRTDKQVYLQYSYRVQTNRSTCSTVTAYRHTGLHAVQLPRTDGRTQRGR